VCEKDNGNWDSITFGELFDSRARDRTEAGRKQEGGGGKEGRRESSCHLAPSLRCAVPVPVPVAVQYILVHTVVVVGYTMHCSVCSVYLYICISCIYIHRYSK